MFVKLNNFNSFNVETTYYLKYCDAVWKTNYFEEKNIETLTLHHNPLQSQYVQ